MPSITPADPDVARSHHSDRLEGANAQGSLWGSLVALTKPRLSMLSVLTAVLAYAAARADWALVTSLAMIVGTMFSAAGALTLNQWFERDADLIMERTRDRPLPRGTVTPVMALAWGLAHSIAGVGLLILWVNGLAALIAAATIVLYVAVYTPLKRRTRWATEVGAIPGALPPLIGWAAAEGGISVLGWILFAILLLWQMPHFFAIGWVYREDYKVAGFPLLPVLDETGWATAVWSLVYTVALVVVSLIPWWMGQGGAVYGITTLTCGLLFLLLAVRFLIENDFAARKLAARHLFFGSLIYLPLVLGVLVLDRLT